MTNHEKSSIMLNIYTLIPLKVFKITFDIINNTSDLLLKVV